MLKSIWEDKRKRIAIIAAVGAMVLVAAGVGGWWAWSNHELDMARASCAEAAQTVETAKAEYAKLADGDDVKTASAVTAEQVRDAKTVETLATELKASEPEAVACPVKDKKAVETTTGKLEEQAGWYKTHKANLNKAVGNVNQSKLDKVIDDANALLNDSDGKVADNVVRDELSKAIEAKDEQKITEATARVNDSINAKTKADEEARAQAEAEAAAAQAAAQAQSYTPTYTNTGYSGYSGYSGGNSGNSNSGGSSSGGSTYSAPQTSTQSNNGGGSSGSDWVSTGDFELGDTTLREKTFSWWD